MLLTITTVISIVIVVFGVWVCLLVSIIVISQFISTIDVVTTVVITMIAVMYVHMHSAAGPGAPNSSK